MMDKWNNKNTKELIEAILLLKSEAEIRQFLRDLLTPQEIIEFGKRWQAARMLNKKIAYLKIIEKTGLSSTTIARVSHWLNKGLGGYKLAIKRLARRHHHSFSAKGLG